VFAKISATNEKGTSSQSSAGNGAVIITYPDAPTSLQENAAVRTYSTVGLTWTASATNGGTPVLDYRISYAVSGGTFSVLADGVTGTSYTVSTLQPGTTYDFKVEARNAYDFSTYSNTVSILVAYVPDAPVLVNDLTTTSDSVIKITWTEPFNGGSEILSYSLSYDQGNGQMTELEASWTLTEYTTDFALVAGTTYVFKATANNVYGASIESELLSVLAARVPEAPLGLQDNPAATTAYQVGLQWTEGIYNGGSVVLDYRVWFKEQSATDFAVFQEAVQSTSTTVTGLSPGFTYDFKVEARNAIGFSEFSSVASVLAAQVPDAPENLSNVAEQTNSEQAGLTWDAPSFDGGSEVLDYRIWSDYASGDTYTEVVTGLQATSYVVTGLTQGQTYQFKVQARNVYGYST
jgi:cellulose 1,4-beta-cellobiosidase